MISQIIIFHKRINLIHHIKFLSLRYIYILLDIIQFNKIKKKSQLKNYLWIFKNLWDQKDNIKGF